MAPYSTATSPDGGGEDSFRIACVDVNAPDAPENFTRSLRTTGFAVLTPSPIDFDLVRTLYAEWRTLFHALDRGAKLSQRRKEAESEVFALTEAEAREERLFEDFLFRAETQDGYFPMSMAEKAKGARTPDIKHYYHCYFPDGRFPTGHVSDGAADLFRQVQTLGRKLLDWVEADVRRNCSPALAAKFDGRLPRGDSGEVAIGGASVPVEGACAACVGDAQTLLRVLHYPAYDDGDVPAGAVRAAAHEDINLITILPSGSARGLEVWDKNARRWLQVPVEEDCVIVNVGDMLQELTEFEYISTTHRVVKPPGGGGGKDRLSVPIFIHPKPDVYLSEKYPRAQLYLEERLRELGVLK
uniref:Fe2OG dioxygenase domain-containing protein n=1 Tax=Corethron hystrix TaxID=216773 RepID=A0A7S1B8L2_9STRA|mmetsp:Transcript_17085/g.38443  ORF Transcript_17085/g.38443 Transcript_17085/m.38443 type:complete len:356 (+) Transcript_17085:311-1378(+)